MAQFTGVECDYCHNFERMRLDDKNVMPVGWVVLTVQAESKGGPNTGLQLCSDRCVAEVGIARWEIANPNSKWARKARRVV